MMVEKLRLRHKASGVRHFLKSICGTTQTEFRSIPGSVGGSGGNFSAEQKPACHGAAETRNAGCACGDSEGAKEGFSFPVVG